MRSVHKSIKGLQVLVNQPTTDTNLLLCRVADVIIAGGDVTDVSAELNALDCVKSYDGLSGAQYATLEDALLAFVVSVAFDPWQYGGEPAATRILDTLVTGAYCHDLKLSIQPGGYDGYWIAMGADTLLNRVMSLPEILTFDEWFTDEDEDEDEDDEDEDIRFENNLEASISEARRNDAVFDKEWKLVENLRRASNNLCDAVVLVPFYIDVRQNADGTLNLGAVTSRTERMLGHNSGSDFRLVLRDLLHTIERTYGREYYRWTAGDFRGQVGLMR